MLSSDALLSQLLGFTNSQFLIFQTSWIFAIFWACYWRCILGTVCSTVRLQMHQLKCRKNGQRFADLLATCIQLCFFHGLQLQESASFLWLVEGLQKLQSMRLDFVSGCWATIWRSGVERWQIDLIEDVPSFDGSVHNGFRLTCTTAPSMNPWLDELCIARL